MDTRVLVRKKNGSVVDADPDEETMRGCGFEFASVLNLKQVKFNLPPHVSKPSALPVLG